MCQELNVEVDENVIPRIATGFAGGLGNTGAVCGAVIGAVMAMGLKMERGETMEDMMGFLGTVAEFRRRFEAEMGSIQCRDLTGADLTTEEGIKQYMESGTPEHVCFPAVATAYRLAVEMLEESE